MAKTYDLTGKVDVSLNGITIPAKYLSSDGVETKVTETTRDIETLAGTFHQATGVYEEASMTFSLVLPNMNYLGNIFPDLYTSSTFDSANAGQIDFGGGDCVSREDTPVVAHYSCQSNSNNDIYIPSGSVVATVDTVQNASDPVMVEVVVNAQPVDNEPLVRFGTGALNAQTLWSAATSTYVSV